MIAKVVLVKMVEVVQIQEQILLVVIVDLLTLRVRHVVLKQLLVTSHHVKMVNARGWESIWFLVLVNLDGTDSTVKCTT